MATGLRRAAEADSAITSLFSADIGRETRPEVPMVQLALAAPHPAWFAEPPHRAIKMVAFGSRQKSELVACGIRICEIEAQFLSIEPGLGNHHRNIAPAVSQARLDHGRDGGVADHNADRDGVRAG